LAVSRTIDWSGCFVLAERNITFSFGVFMYYVARRFYRFWQSEIESEQANPAFYNQSEYLMLFGY